MNASQTPQTYELQRIVFAADPTAAGLYCRISDNNALTIHNRRDASLKEGCTVDFNTFFGNFYEIYWQKFTSINEISLSFHLHGAIDLELWRSDVLLSKTELTGAGEVITLPIPKTQNPSRLFIRIHALSDAKLSNLIWSTAQAPARTPRVMPVICTYNREQDIAAILSALSSPQQQNLFGDIIVINHDENHLADRLNGLITGNPRFKIHDQENSGGSGGFTRGLVEAQSVPGGTHALLLDDDIRIDPELLRRIPIILGYALPNLAIGGAMLDRLQPAMLHNNVTRLNTARMKVEPAIANADLSNAQSLDLFTSIHSADFCGWWCAALPIAPLQQTGLPLPFFLHYDDVEFGLRLADVAVTNVNWPGIAVWHEPFYVKAKAWRRYYDFRNVLFLLVLHDRLDATTARREFAWRFRINIQKHDYPAAWAILQAAKHFLIGPSKLADWNARDHQQLINDAEAWARPGNQPRRNWLKILRLTAVFCRIYIRFPSSRHWQKQDLKNLTTPDFWRKKRGL